jgi:mono/diheme cytochrome c family protein
MKKIFSLALIALGFAVSLMAAGRETTLNTVAAAADVQTIYKEKCVKCHGADGKGIKSLEPPDFTDAKWQASRKDAQFIAVINNGKETMPGFKDAIAPADVRALVKLVRGFAPKPAAAPVKKK